MIAMFDTCALIALTNEASEHHAIANACYTQLKRNGDQLRVSVVTVSEYGVRAAIDSIVPRLFPTPPSFGLPHASMAAQFARLTSNKKKLPRLEDHDRQFIAADTLILAQAEVEQVDCILTCDTRTLARTADLLKNEDLLHVSIVMLNSDPLFHLGLASSASLSPNQ